MSKGAKHPDKTGMRCLICYAWEIKLINKDRQNQTQNQTQTQTQTKIEHELACPYYRA